MSLVSAAEASLDSVLSLRDAAGGGGVDVDFDLTAVGQIVLFLVLLFVLKPLLFDPMLRLFEERERRIDGAKLLARKIDERSGEALTTYENEMAKARAGANAERDALREQGMKEEGEILARVRASTAKTLDEARTLMQAEVAKTRATLQGETGLLARELAGRVLGREVQ